jgi:hypothetical protein
VGGHFWLPDIVGSELGAAVGSLFIGCWVQCCCIIFGMLFYSHIDCFLSCVKGVLLYDLP